MDFPRRLLLSPHNRTSASPCVPVGVLGGAGVVASFVRDWVEDSRTTSSFHEIAPVFSADAPSAGKSDSAPAVPSSALPRKACALRRSLRRSPEESRATKRCTRLFRGNPVEFDLDPVQRAIHEEGRFADTLGGARRASGGAFEGLDAVLRPLDLASGVLDVRAHGCGSGPCGSCSWRWRCRRR